MRREHNGQRYFYGAPLVAFQSRLFEVRGKFQLIETSVALAAVGSGAEHVPGSPRLLKGKPHERLLEALKVSAENNAGVAPPFDVIEVKSWR